MAQRLDSIGAAQQGAPGAAPALGLDIRFVLVEPSHPGNIGASARAIASMGFTRLDVVRPREPQFRTHAEAVALAASAADVLAAAQVHGSLAEALEGVSMAYATTGYARDHAQPPVEVRGAARAAAQEAALGPVTAAFVFGPERTGLANADVQRCHRCCSIPCDPVRGSLNLAQAVQVVAYECRREWLACTGGSAEPAPRRDASQGSVRAEDPVASVAQTEALFDHLEAGLVSVGYLDPEEPKHLMARLRRLLLRSQPTTTEVDILRGIAAAMVLPRRLRAGRKAPR